MQLADMNQEGLYNVLLEWGKSHILSPKITSYLKRLEEYCNPFMQDDNLESVLLHSIEELKKQVDNAMLALSNIELVFVEEDDDMALWREAENAFTVLDKVNYLMEAVHFLVAPYKNSICEKVIRELDKIFLNITSWLGEGDFSPMRFISMNDFRRERLNFIPEENRYRFPWYENYSNYDENTIGTLVLYFDDFLSKNWKKLKQEIPGERLIEIWYELKRDKQLLTLVRREAVLQKALFEAVSVPSSVKLLGLRSDESLDYILPECVENAGVIRVCVDLLNDAILEVSSEAEKVFWIYLTAFCDPSLDDNERLEFLNIIEDGIDKIDITEVSGEKHKLLGRLKNWFKREYEDSSLVNDSFDTWLKLIEQKASHMMVSEIDAEPGELRIAVNNIVSKEIPLQVSEPSIIIFNPAVKRNERKIIKLPSFDAKLPKVKVAREETANKSIELKIGINPIYFSLYPYDENEYPIIPSPDKVFDCNAIDEYRKLWDKFGKYSCYAGGICLKENWEIKKIPIQLIDRKIFGRIKSNEGFRNAVVVVSNGKVCIEKFIQLFQNSFDWANEEIKKLNVIVLDILLEKNL